MVRRRKAVPTAALRRTRKDRAEALVQDPALLAAIERIVREVVVKVMREPSGGWRPRVTPKQIAARRKLYAAMLVHSRPPTDAEREAIRREWKA